MKKFLSLIALAFFAITTVTAQTDFNYSFYPAPKYTKFQTVNYADTTNKEPMTGKDTFIEKTDTVTSTVNVFIEKENGRFSVRTLANISETIYDMNVVFIGVDNSGNMVYKAKSQSESEMIFVNPLFGIVEIVFKNCFDEPLPDGLVKKRCNIVRHIFGTLPTPKTTAVTKK